MKNQIYTTVEEALDILKQGRLIILTDDEKRENEGDLVLIAEKATPKKINFMATHGRGLICAAIIESIAQRLDLPVLVRNNTSPFATAFTISIDAKRGTTTGISSFDRALTIKTIANPDATADEFYRPGHVFPLIAKEGGTLARAGHTEAAVDLALMANSPPAGVICEIMDDDGDMARGKILEAYARRHDLKILTIRTLVEYRRRNMRPERIEENNSPC